MRIPRCELQRPRTALRPAGLLLLAVALGLHAPRRDLDVGVPPGSPTDWTRAHPVVHPPREPLFPLTPDAPRGNRSVSAPVGARQLDLRVKSSFGLVRILTWDLAAHLSWLGGSQSGGDGPVTGRHGQRPRPTRYGDPLYWVSLAPLLRLLLHPGQTPQAQTIAHLVELGDATAAALDEAQAEGSLRRVTKEVRERVAATRDGEPSFAPATARQAMLARYAAGELLRHEPYDPEAPFAARVLLFSEELLPVLHAFALDEDAATLRRNAVAALARYRTADAERALFDVAIKTQDPVCLMRALNALGRDAFEGPRVDWTPLVQRLAATRESPERVALVDALGRIGCEEVVRELLAFAKRASENTDSDELISALLALARVPLTTARREVDELLANVERRAESTPRVFQPPGPKPTVEADRPDGPRTRGRTIEQLAVLASVLRDPRAPKAKARVLGLVGAEDLTAAGTDYSGLLLGVEPPAQLLFLEVLGRLASEGVVEAESILKSVARRLDRPILAARALPELPRPRRREIALSLLGGVAGVGSEARLLGFEMLLADLDVACDRAARGLLEECAALEDGAGDAATRFLYLRAVEALDARGTLRVEDLLPLLHHVRALELSFADLPDEVELLVVGLVDTAALGVQRVELRRRVQEILDLLIRHAMNAAITEETRSSSAEHVLELVADVRSHRRDPGYLQGVRAQVLAFLLGYERKPAYLNPSQFEPPVLLEREILLALGRTRSPQAAELLLQVLENPRNANRGVACLALGMTAQREAAGELARFLLDEDPFVRFAAYEALRHLTNRPHEFVDWMHAPAAERYAAAEEWWQWLVEHPVLDEEE